MLSINDLHEDEYNEVQTHFLGAIIDPLFQPIWEIVYRAQRRDNTELRNLLHMYASSLADATKPTQDENI